MKKIIENAPHVAKCFYDLTEAITDYGNTYNIEPKIKEIILVAAFAAVGGYTGVTTHAKRALESGAKQEEVIASILYIIPVCGISKANMAIETIMNL